MKKGTHIWWHGYIWIVIGRYKINKETIYEVENIVEEFVSRLTIENFKLPICDPSYAKILWTP